MYSARAMGPGPTFGGTGLQNSCNNAAEPLDRAMIRRRVRGPSIVGWQTIECLLYLKVDVPNGFSDLTFTIFWIYCPDEGHMRRSHGSDV